LLKTESGAVYKSWLTLHRTRQHTQEVAMLTHVGSAGSMTAYQKQHTDSSVKNSAPGPKKAPASDTLTLNEPAPAAAAYTRDQTASLRQLILDTFKEQGLSARIATNDTFIDFQDLTPEAARDLIAEDGYFGVTQTADRIVTAAVALAGSDPAKLDQIKAGIDKGFDMAAQALGGSLPDISSQTYDAVMEKLDVWAQGGVVV
jgi:hypothetical protein